MKQFTINGNAYFASDCKSGILIDPVLPLGFMSNDTTELKPEDLAAWWNRPFIQVDRGDTGNNAFFSELELTQIKTKFYEVWPHGMFKLYVLENARAHGYECGPTLRGCFKNIESALESAIAWNIAVEYDS